MEQSSGVTPDAIKLPVRWAQRHVVDGNAARQLVAGPRIAVLEREGNGWFARINDEVRYEIHARGRTPFGTAGLEVVQGMVTAENITHADLRWVTSERCADPDDVLAGLADRFHLRTEDTATGARGLRIPQTGALHALLAHWSTGTTEPATVVLPTGTGKTETMIALFLSELPERLLVLVPSDNLRTQIAEAFEVYGVLPEVGALDPPEFGPVVGRIEHHFADVASMRSFVDRCNVVVATPGALGASSDSVFESLTRRCGMLFVDEAHHVAAKSWSRVRDAFHGKPVAQFTATPFRADGERLGGRLIYSFPLGRAQDLGYFQPISYISVVALAEPDRAVAVAAVSQLRQDLDNGFDHLIMARVNRIGRARDEILPLYREIAAEFEPCVLHSDLRASERSRALAAIIERRSRIVVCVDMLGEGFNFPELKIAALHDPHRSLGVALQFIGRFARTRADLGTATAVVARPEPGYDERLRALYAERNQWDAVIRTLSTQAIEQVQEMDDFEVGFGPTGPDELSIHALRPKMSTVVYRTRCPDWQPDRLAELFEADTVIAPLAVNAGERVAWIVVESRSAVRWAELHSIENVDHHLHVLHWDKERSLLYINSSDLESLHEDLAQTMCGEDVERITGEAVYRVLGALSRPVPTNVGVIDLRNRSRRFSMYVGADVYEGFPTGEQQTKSNTNIFVFGFAEGERVTMGAARKGRIWSQQAAPSVLHWVQWCRRLGPKLLDDAIDLGALFRSFVRPRPLEERPNLMPLAMDWQWQPFAGVGDSVKLEVAGAEHHLIDVELVLVDQTTSGPVQFQVRGEDFSLPYEADVRDGALVHRALDSEARVLRERSEPEALSAYLNREGSLLWFEDEVLIDGPDLLLALQRDRPAIDLDQLVELDWSGVDIRRESQGPERDPATVQAYAATHLAGLREWDVIVDDDGTAEIADLVALKEDDDRVVVHLVHCKYSSQDETGARLADLYELCGQAHRSAHHRQQLAAMVKNLIRRERKRRGRGTTGLMKGSDADLLRLQDLVRMRRPELHITVVQPGLSKEKAEARHLQVLGAADLYVKEIAHATFEVWCSV